MVQSLYAVLLQRLAVIAAAVIISSLWVGPTTCLAASNTPPVLGFNYAANDSLTNTYKHYDDFVKEFNAARSLAFQNAMFTSARLYTSIQGDKVPTAGQQAQQVNVTSYIEAIDAAIDTGTSLLLGLWASSGQATIDLEIASIVAAVNNRSKDLANSVIGISVGSEDVYRTTALGSSGGSGADAKSIASYIDQLRSKLAGTALANVKIGHVDTFTVWANASGDPDIAALISKVDFIGVNAFPYYEKDKSNNSIKNAKQLFQDDLTSVQAQANGKEVWITETGWATSGPKYGSARASVRNAARYWKDVGCSVAIANGYNTWWYILDDDPPNGTNMSASPYFGVAHNPDIRNSQQPLRPLFDLSC